MVKKEKRLYKKLKCKKHNQHLFYVYVNTDTGQIGTICQVCEDEAITAMRDEELRNEEVDKAHGV